MSSRMRYSLGALGLAALPLLPAGPARAQDTCAERLPTERTSMELRGADIQTTLRLLALRYRVNLLMTDEVAGSVTLSFFDVPVRDVFRTIVDAGNLRCVPRDGVLQVSTAARLLKQDDDRARADQARRREEADVRRSEEDLRRRQNEDDDLRARGPLREETIRLAYADAVDVAETLQGILGLPATGTTPVAPGILAPPPPTQIPDPSRTPGFLPGPEGRLPPGPLAMAPGGPPAGSDILVRGLTIRAHKPTNSVFMRLYENDLARIRRLIKENLDIPLPQVQIAAQIVVTSRNALEQLGVQWGGSVASTGSPTLVGQGFAQPVSSATGLPAQFSPSTGAVVSPPNPNFTPGLPIAPTTGLPTGGNIINLPISSLPTAANPALGLLFGIVGRNFNVNLAIQALEVQGKARSISEPKIVTVENATAVISRGFEVPYVSQTGFGGTQVQFKDALLKLEVKPSVIREPTNTRIKMKVLVEDNNPDFTRQVQGNPPIFKRRGETEVVVREGERLVIGGVLVENENSTIRQVPGLGRIPVLGWLFKSREISTDGQELIVIITPTVLPMSVATAR
jgi:type IV pilus assembly protein PilQ